MAPKIIPSSNIRGKQATTPPKLEPEPEPIIEPQLISTASQTPRLGISHEEEPFFTPLQLAAIGHIIRGVLSEYGLTPQIRPPLPPEPQLPIDSPEPIKPIPPLSPLPNSTQLPIRERSFPTSLRDQLRPQDVGFFHPEADDPTGSGISLIGHHTAYTDVWPFVQRLQGLATTYGDQAIREVFPLCLRGSALLWLSVELLPGEHHFYSTTVTTAELCSHLKTRFSDPPSIAMAKMNSARYSFRDSREGTTIRVFSQRILRYARSANYLDEGLQAIAIYNSLDIGIRQLFPTPTLYTTLREFYRVIDEKEPIVHELATRNSHSNRYTSPNFQPNSGPNSTIPPGRPQKSTPQPGAPNIFPTTYQYKKPALQAQAYYTRPEEEIEYGSEDEEVANSRELGDPGGGNGSGNSGQWGH